LKPDDLWVINLKSLDDDQLIQAAILCYKFANNAGNFLDGDDASTAPAWKIRNATVRCDGFIKKMGECCDIANSRGGNVTQKLKDEMNKSYPIE